jgi:hypothetical protein
MTIPRTSYNYGPIERRVDVSFTAHRYPGLSEGLAKVTLQAPTNRAGSGDAKWAKGYAEGAQLGRQMAAARGHNVSKQGEQ